MKVLIIDNNIDSDSWGARDLSRQVREISGATVVVRRAPQEDLPKNPGFDKLIISGSRTSATDQAPWIDQLMNFIRETVDRGKPVLGVCYGHQTLVRAFGGAESVRRAQTGEFGWSRIDRIGDSALFAGLPESFHSFSSHFDEVATLPSGFKLLAKSEACGIQACELEGKAVFGIQFHPEKNLEEAKKSILGWKNQRKKRKFLLNAGDSEKLFDENVGKTIFTNFLKI